MMGGVQTTCVYSSAGRYLGLLTVLVFVLASAGCSSQARHQVLTFFFTGVPPANEEQAKLPSGAKSAAEAKRSRPDEKKRKAGEQGSLPTVPEPPRLYSHTPWVEGNCSACHEGAASFGFQMVGQSKRSSADKVFFSGGGMPGKLRQPKDKICTTCHTDKTGLRAIKDDLWLHNPTAKGECLACHDAHQSKQRGVLRRPPEQLCQPCHPAEKLAAIPMHSTSNKPCLSCHNPHMGKDRRMLTQDYQEVKPPARRALQIVD